MKRIIINDLMSISVPVIERFAAVEPQPWTRKAILLELVGEVGSLAHLIQHWDGCKRGQPDPAQLADECSDVLFMILRLAYREHIFLPHTIGCEQFQDMRATDHVLELSRGAAALQDPNCNSSIALMSMLATLACLSDCLGIDLMQAHQREMEIASYFFKASGDRWPKPQPLHHPFEAFHLARLLWKKRMGSRKSNDI